MLIEIGGVYDGVCDCVFVFVGYVDWVGGVIGFG